MSQDEHQPSVTRWGRILPEHARALLGEGLEKLDPCGLLTPEGLARMTERGECSAILGDDGQAGVIVTRKQNGVLWVDAIKGQGGRDLTATADRIMTSIGQAEGLERIGLQTMRPGLRRKLEARGFVVTGWIMHKRIKK